jgi:hypothetical protein
MGLDAAKRNRGFTVDMMMIVVANECRSVWGVAALVNPASCTACLTAR